MTTPMTAAAEPVFLVVSITERRHGANDDGRRFWLAHGEPPKADRRRILPNGETLQGYREVPPEVLAAAPAPLAAAVQWFTREAGMT